MQADRGFKTAQISKAKSVCTRRAQSSPLAPAFDVTYSYNPSGDWTATHQMTLNGKREGFAMEDFRAGAKGAMMKRGRAEAIVEEVTSVVARWPDFAVEARVADDLREKIQKTHRLGFPDV